MCIYLKVHNFFLSRFNALHSNMAEQGIFFMSVWHLYYMLLLPFLFSSIPAINLWDVSVFVGNMDMQFDKRTQ